MNKLLLIALLVVSQSAFGQIIKTVAGTGTPGYSGDGGPAIMATINYTQYITIDKSNNIYISDKLNHAIRKISNVGIISTIAGNGSNGFNGDNIVATSAELSYPTCVAIDTAQNIYIAEAGKCRIRKIDKTGIITTIAGNGICGYNGDNGPATNAKIAPYGLALDEAGNIYISDGVNNVIRKVSIAGTITTIAGDGTTGFYGDGGPATNAKFGTIGYLTVNSSGDIYVPDWPNHRIRKITSVGIISTVVGKGTSGYSGDGGPATNAELIAGNAVNFDAYGNYYISDNVAHVIRKVNTSGIISTFAGNGTQGFYGDGGPATNAHLNTPNGITINSAGNFFIVDGLNQRIRKVTYHPEAINDINNKLQHVSIWPNPAHDEIAVAWEGGTVQAGNEVAVINIAGQVVISECHTGSNVTLHTDKLTAGVYLVTVNGAYAGRFVKEY